MQQDINEIYKSILNEEGGVDSDKLTQVESIYHMELAKMLIKEGKGDQVTYSLWAFKEVDHNELIKLLVEAGLRDNVYDNFSDFQNLSLDTAKYLLDRDPEDTSMRRLVASNLGLFKDLDIDIAKRLVEADEFRSLAEGITSFSESVDRNEIVLFALEKNVSDFESGLYYFSGLTANTAKLLSDKGFVEVLGDQIKIFKESDHDAVAKLLIEKGNPDAITRNIDSFKNLSKDVSDYFRQNGMDWVFERCPEAFVAL